MASGSGIRKACAGAAAVIVVLVSLIGALVSAHEMTVKGTVAALEEKRIQVKTGEEKKGTEPAWFPLDAKTKFMRGTTTVTRDQAKITTGEKVVVIVDHETNGTMKTLEIRLAAQ